MPYPSVTATGQVADPPQRVAHPTKAITHLRVAFVDPHSRDEPLFMTISAYGPLGDAAAILEVGEQVIIVGYLKPIRRGNFAGHPEMIATAIGVVPETDDVTST